VAQDSSFTDRLIKKLKERFTLKFAYEAPRIAETLVERANQSTTRQLQSSLRDAGLEITLKSDFFAGATREVMQKHIAYNVNLIKRIPARFLDQVYDDVEKALGPNGNGLQDLIPAMEKRYADNSRWARHVALDQTRKAYNDLTAEKMQSIDQDEYEWIHSAGSDHPREYHLKRWPDGLNGGRFKLSDPPIIDDKTGQRGKPGDLPFCRCRMRPIVRFKPNAAPSR